MITILLLLLLLIIIRIRGSRSKVFNIYVWPYHTFEEFSFFFSGKLLLLLFWKCFFVVVLFLPQYIISRSKSTVNPDIMQ